MIYYTEKTINCENKKFPSLLAKKFAYFLVPAFFNCVYPRKSPAAFRCIKYEDESSELMINLMLTWYKSYKRSFLLEV